MVGSNTLATREFLTPKILPTSLQFPLAKGSVLATVTHQGGSPFHCSCNGIVSFFILQGKSSPFSSTMITANNVFWFIPNLIGYSRVVCGLAAFVLWMIFPQSWLWGLLLYLGSFVGDAVDGWAARKWDQCSTFGSVLDMVTDRCATLGLLQILTAEFSHIPDSSLLNQVCPLVLVLLATLDISSHWCQMYASLLTKSHHKSAEANQDANPLVQLYYANYYFFGYLCVGAELTYILALVFVKTLPSSAVPMLTWVIILPACVMKQLVNVAQLLSACRAIAQHDADLYNQKHRGTTSSNSKKD